MVGTGRAAALGIFVRGGDVLERLAKVDRVAFDKTGTLTERHAEVTWVAVVPGVGEDDLLSWAAAVEAESDHPIATAILARAGRPARASQVQSIPGTGVAGLVDQHRVEVTRSPDDELPECLRGSVSARSRRGDTVVAVSRDGETVGAIALSTPVREEAPAAIGHPRSMGLESVILSGDREPAVSAVAGRLGIESFRSGLSPDGKVEALTTMGRTGGQVLMVGDGINDTPALAAAAVGCAIGSGSEAALAHSDLALLRSDLEGVPQAVGVARSTYGVIVQNFAWAMGYNVAALPLAAAGLLDPLVAAVAMGLSSVIVVLNSLRLARVGRSGVAVSARPAGDRRTVILSVLLPVVLFAALTVVSQALSPARGQPLLPVLPDVTTVALPDGGSAQSYLSPGTAGVNQFHLFLSGPAGDLRTANPQVTVEKTGAAPELRPAIRLSPGHFTSVAVLTPGTWRFHVTGLVAGRAFSFTVSRQVT